MMINHDHVDNSEVNGRQMFFFWFILSITVECTMEDKYNVTLLLKVSCTVVGGRRWGAELHSLDAFTQNLLGRTPQQFCRLFLFHH